MMKPSNCLQLVLAVLCVFLLVQTYEAAKPVVLSQSKTCFTRNSPCFMKKQTCPHQCPSFSPTEPKSKVCFVDCNSPICQAQCRNRKPNCNGKGSACLDPRFIGGDGIVFYFHGRSNEHFSLVSDLNLQINARFIGLRPSGRNRDFTWIQALGILFDQQSITLEATKSTKWDEKEEHLKLTHNGKDIILPEGDSSIWKSSGIKAERTSEKNSVLITLPDVAEISVNVVPVTKEDDRIHSYGVPENDCFAHLEVQFRFDGLSPMVEGVLGRTYRLDFENPAKPGVVMPVVGGEDKYRTTSLLSADCGVCVFSPVGVPEKMDPMLMNYGAIDCSSRASSGNGIVCRK